MRIGRMVAPVHALGPGERVCLWTQGCSKYCPGCISEELQPDIGPDVQETILADILKKTAERSNCDGLTISGGDPFEQADALLRLLQLVRPVFQDILVYTGFQYEEIISCAAGDSGKDCLALIDVLIDGRYVDALNRPEFVLRGSGNQNIYYLNRDAKPVYEAYMRAGRIIECFAHNDTTLITGILDKKE